MDVHKPKPWHGVRELLKEIGTIVVGVLIALGAEAVVEKLHEDRLSAEARAAVRDEINVDLTNMKRREALEPCIARRLAELSDFVAKAEAGQPFEPPQTIGAPGHPLVHTGRWAAATAGGRTSLLALDEQRDLARVYSELEVYQAMKPVEREVWGELDGLEGVRRPSPELLARARAAIGRARLMDIAAQRTLKEGGMFAARIGIRGDAQNLVFMPYASQYICLPLSTSPADAAKAGGDPLAMSP